MNNPKITRRLTMVLVSYSVINILLIMMFLITHFDTKRRLNNLERKIEVLEIHIFPEEFHSPPAETKM